jgi:putative zinc finger/helix-turn-helix YgiT family protein
MQIAYCPKCKSRESVETLRSKETIEIRGKTIEVDAEYFKCTNCKEEFSSFDGHDEVAEGFRKYRTMYNMLQPEEIKSFRKSYDLTQGELAKLLGFSVATISRYENGGLQEKSHDNLLKMAMEPKGFIRLINENRKALTEQKRHQLLEKINHTSEISDLDPEEFTSRLFSHPPDEYSGFREFNLERFEAATLFLCEGGEPKTKLNKLLYYVDMKCYKDNASPLTGAQYIHLDHGPVPNNYDFLFGVMISTGKLTTREVILGEIVYDEYLPIEKANLRLFSPTEQKILKFVRNHFEKFSATKIREYSHKEEAYLKTRNKEPISYAFAKSLSL